MKRREFIKNSALASSLFMVPSFVKAFETVATNSLGFKKLVIIQLAGGNDGLNTVVPFTDEIYYQKRPNIAIDKSQLILLNKEVGLNKNMLPLRKLYDKGYFSIVNNVGYKNPSKSHAHSFNIWQSAGDAAESINSGWIGRYIDHYSDNPYTGVELNDSLSLIMKGEKKNGAATKFPNILYKNTQSDFFKSNVKAHEGNPLGDSNLDFLYKTMLDANTSAKKIYNASESVTTDLDYPDNPFSKQLKIVAKLINSGLDTKVYSLAMGGFDTHYNQVTEQDKLLGIYSSAMEVFIDDLENSDTFKDTLILTYSEFGRSLNENSFKGTEHGTSNNVFLMGKSLKKKGLYNEMANLADLDINGDLKHTVDFREIYATVLKNWLEVDDEKVLKHPYTKLDII